MSEFHSLATLIKRLEVATTRLEDLALSGTSASTVTATHTATPTTAAYPTQAKEAQVELPRVVEAFSNAVDSPLKQYVELSKQLGGPVGDQVNIITLKRFMRRRSGTRRTVPDYVLCFRQTFCKNLSMLSVTLSTLPLLQRSPT